MEHVVSKNKCIPLKTLQQYKKGSVNKQQRSAVEAHLPTCELCSYTVASTTKINDEELAEDLPTLRHSITDTLMERKKAKRQQAGNQGNRRTLYSIAAALAFLLTLGVAAQLFLQSNTPDNLYAQYYQSYEIPDDLVRSIKARSVPSKDADNIAINSEDPVPNNNPSVSEPLAQAIATYKNIPYEASDIPSSFNQDPHEAALTQLLKGLTLLEKGNTTAAIPLLEKVQKSKTKYAEDATWYLALSHLKTADNTTTISLLDQLLALNNGFYYKKAQALKKQLQ